MVSVRDWPAEAQRFYAGMIESRAVNGQVIVHPDDAAVAEELEAAAGERRMPSTAALISLALRKFTL